MTTHDDARRSPAFTGRTRYGNRTLTQTYGLVVPGDDEVPVAPIASSDPLRVETVIAPI